MEILKKEMEISMGVRKVEYKFDIGILTLHFLLLYIETLTEFPTTTCLIKNKVILVNMLLYDCHTTEMIL
jgi:hypothetical protein